MPAQPQSPTVWVLLGKRRGDNNQAIALAEALGVPFIEKPLRFTLWRYLPRRLTAFALWTVDAETRHTLVSPWPALAIAVGKRSVPILRAIRALSGGATRTVILGEPRSPPHWFDLVLSTPQYRVPAAGNVHILPLALSKGVARHEIGAVDGPPTHVLLVGGTSWPWRPDVRTMIDTARHCLELSMADGGSVLAMTGERTAQRLKEALVAVLGADNVDQIDYRAALACGTIFYVTADSASMLSDAITTGRPVAMVPVKSGGFGRLWMASWRWVRPKSPLWPRDLPHFWKLIRARGMVGTVDAPRAGTARDTAALAANLVAPLLGIRVEPKTPPGP
jgi:mitochondrial fission protein ELM1